MSADDAMDRLSSLLERFRLQAELHHSGTLCGVNRFEAREGHGYLHLLRRGALDVQHRLGRGRPQVLRLDQPTLLFYPRPLEHTFVNPPREGADFTCARVSFVGGPQHPLVRALPPVIALPLSKLPTLALALDLLFSETDRARCGQRLLVNRIFEVVLIQLLRWLLDHPGEAGIQPGLITGLSDPRLARALVAMHEAPGEPWTLQRMAGRAGMSRSAYAGRFREIVGQTPADYLGDWRMVLAQSRLREGESIKRLADELGYANPSALSRAFAMRVGRSPSAWLKTARTQDRVLAPTRAGE